MKSKIILAAIAFAAMCVPAADAQSKPTREVKMPTEHGLGVTQTNYQDKTTGFFMAGEAVGGYSLNSGKDNFGFAEIDATGGYRFSEFFRAGIGLGVRRYFNDESARHMHHQWGMPLFVNFRGNFISTDYRNAVPFWSIDFGGSFPDGAMIRPTVGVRVGQQRSAFIASIGYMGQNIKTLVNPDKKHSFYSFIAIKLGYEF